MMKYFTIKSKIFCILKFVSDNKIEKTEIYYKNYTFKKLSTLFWLKMQLC